MLVWFRNFIGRLKSFFAGFEELNFSYINEKCSVKGVGRLDKQCQAVTDWCASLAKLLVDVARGFNLVCQTYKRV